MDKHPNPHPEDRAYEVLAGALAADGVSQVGLWPVADGADTGQQASLANLHDHEPAHDHPPAADLRGIEALPGRIRRRLGAILGAGETVECVVEGANRHGTKYLVATTHRVIALGGGRNARESSSLSLPYHRTEPVELGEALITLSCNEFGTAVTATIEPGEGSTLEVSHILDRIATA